MSASQPEKARTWTLHRRDCRKQGGYGELGYDFSPWIECPDPNGPHDPEVEHVPVVEQAALDRHIEKARLEIGRRVVAEDKLAAETARANKAEAELSTTPADAKGEDVSNIETSGLRISAALELWRTQRAVIEAAKAWHGCKPSTYLFHISNLHESVAALEAAEAGREK